MKKYTLRLIFLLFFTAGSALAQEAEKEAPKDWFHLSFDENGYYGINTEGAYQLLKGKESRTVVVAVIDSGIDFDHEDLQDNIWKNADEVAGDGKDNDNNGYTDDVHGWSFIGGAEGDVDQDTYELTRIYKGLKAKYEGKTEEEVSDKKEFAYYQEIEKAYKEKLQTTLQSSLGFMGFYTSYERFHRLLSAYLDKEEGQEITKEDLEGIETEDQVVAQAKGTLMYTLEAGYTMTDMQEGVEYYDNLLKYSLNLEYEPRKIVGDDYDDLDQRDYGNNHIEGPDADHGTHVAGIIGAKRGNQFGMDGIADNVKIMVLRTVPAGGDERDKDVASAIYYAVDNGAQIINMSFGKAYSPHQDAVEKAMRYAESKGVLLIHAAGNDGKNTVEESNFPTAERDEDNPISTWLEVGASSWHSDEKLVASFSNYGDRVDVFAPGVAIYSTIPDNQYKSLQGTSMAAPVVSGVAALLMSYFPELSAADVKEIIMESATVLKKKEVHKPGTGSEEEDPEVVRFKELGKVPGIVNAYEAVKMAKKVARKKR